MKPNSKTFQILGTLLVTICVTVISYCLDRSSFEWLILLFTVAFLGYFIFTKSKEDHSFYYGLIPRVILVFSLPNLSDDFYRFLFDGEVLNMGSSPFSKTPTHFISLNKNHSDFIGELYPHLNSKGYYAIYPPLNQWLFWIAAQTKSIAGGVIVLKTFLLGFEIGTYYFMRKICQRFQLPLSTIAFYWLNPLVIVELIGNCHFEGTLLFFLLAGLYHLARLKQNDGSILFALSVISKLFSLMFLPLIVLKSGWRKGIKTILITTLIVIASFYPFLQNGELLKIWSSIDLYFQKFEFNAGLFYIVRWLGFQIKGYDVIQLWGPLLSACSTLGILIVSWLYRFRNRLALFKAFTLIFTLYLFFSPIVHPWYIVTLLGLGIFTNYKFPIVWSAVATLSYFAYSNPEFRESPILLWIEYIVVFGFFIWEVKKRFSWNKLISGMKI